MCVWLHMLFSVNSKEHLWPPCCSSVGGVQTWHSPALVYACRLAVAFGPTLLAATVSWRGDAVEVYTIDLSCLCSHHCPPPAATPHVGLPAGAV